MNMERGRAWRRLQHRMSKGKSETSLEIFKPEKKWKMLYLRSEKLKRAKQLGFEYPDLKFSSSFRSGTSSR
jgi:hypothetical protein